MLNKNKISVAELVSKFKINPIANKEAMNNNFVYYLVISRVGLELTGCFIYKEIKCIVYLGSKESKYLKELSDKKAREVISKIFESKPPLVILGKNFYNEQLILEIATKYRNVPIVKTKFNFNEVNFTFSNYLIERLAHYNIHHGTLVEVFGVGIFLVGESGVGKSEIAMELVRKGHIFIGDDAIDIARIGDTLRARSNELTKGFIEVRGLGILSFEKTFGYHKSIDNTDIEVVIELVNNDKKHHISYERLGKTNYTELEGLQIPYYKIPILPGRRTSEIVESAITDYKLKKLGYDSASELKQRINNKRKEHE